MLRKDLKKVFLRLGLAVGPSLPGLSSAGEVLPRQKLFVVIFFISFLFLGTRRGRPFSSSVE